MLEFSLLSFWLIVIIACLVIEAITLDLVSIWFAVGGMAAFIAANFDIGVIPQFAVFAIISACSLAGVRPFCKKWLRVRIQATNSDRIIGKPGVVVETIDNLKETGAVKINGLVWTARSLDSNRIDAGNIVEIVSIEGVKVIVKASEKQNII